MTLEAQWWNNLWHGPAVGTATKRTLEVGCLGPPSRVCRAGRRHCGPHGDVVGTHTVDPGRRGVYLARRGSCDVGGVPLVPARASRASTWVMVDEVHAHPRHGPYPVVGQAVLTGPTFAASSALRQFRLTDPTGMPHEDFRAIRRHQPLIDEGSRLLLASRASRPSPEASIRQPSAMSLRGDYAIGHLPRPPRIVCRHRRRVGGMGGGPRGGCL